jgi:ATP-dependent DNA helicase PIF1
MFLNFREALDDLSQGSCSEKSYATFKSRFLDNLNNEELRPLNNATHIFTVRSSVIKYNRAKLLGLHCPIAKIPAQHNNSTAEIASTDDARGLERILYLAKGARVVVKSNLWVEAGLVNGTLGTVVDIVYAIGKSSPKDLPDVVMVRFDHYRGPTLNGLFPVPVIERNWMTKNKFCTRTQIPLSLAWGFTVHQSQGQTHEKVRLFLLNYFSLFIFTPL